MYLHESVRAAPAAGTATAEVLRIVRCYLRDDAFVAHHGLKAVEFGDVTRRLRFEQFSEPFPAVEVTALTPVLSLFEQRTAFQALPPETKANEIAGAVVSTAAAILQEIRQRASDEDDTLTAERAPSLDAVPRETVFRVHYDVIEPARLNSAQQKKADILR